MSSVVWKNVCSLQALPTADHAHFLWCGSNGCLVCHCWLNTEETPSRLTKNTTTQHRREMLFSISRLNLVPLIHKKLIKRLQLLDMVIIMLHKNKYLTKEWHFMDGWLKGRLSICWQDICVDTLKCARPTVNIKGIKGVCMDICYQIVLYCWPDNHFVLHIHLHRYIDLMDPFNRTGMIGPP